MPNSNHYAGREGGVQTGPGDLHHDLFTSDIPACKLHVVTKMFNVYAPIF